MGNEFLDELGVTLTKTAKGLTEKAESIYETQKLRNKIASEKRAMERVLEDMGRIIYKRYCEGEEPDEELKDLCIEADMHGDRISVYKEELAGKKGKKICPACQREVDREVSYCPYCGSPCPVHEPEEETPAKEEEAVKEAPAPEKPAAEETSAAEEAAEEAPAAEEPAAEEVPAAEEPAPEEAPAKEDAAE